MAQVQKRAAGRFPQNRIKKIILRNEDVGKLAGNTPAVTGKALELFLQDLMQEVVEQAAAGNSGMQIGFPSIQATVQQHKRFHFLCDLADVEPMEDEEIEAAARARKKQRKEKQKGGDEDEDEEEDEDEDEEEDEDEDEDEDEGEGEDEDGDDEDGLDELRVKDDEEGQEGGGASSSEEEDSDDDED